MFTLNFAFNQVLCWDLTGILTTQMFVNSYGSTNTWVAKCSCIAGDYCDTTNFGCSPWPSGSTSYGKTESCSVCSSACPTASPSITPQPTSVPISEPSPEPTPKPTYLQFSTSRLPCIGVPHGNWVDDNCVPYAATEITIDLMGFMGGFFHLDAAENECFNANGYYGDECAANRHDFFQTCRWY